MISKISFKSTYIATLNKTGKDKFYAFTNFALMNSHAYGAFSMLTDKTSTQLPFKYSSDCILIVPKSNNNEVEGFCKSRGIFIEKIPTENLSVSKKILEKIKPPEQGKQIVFVNFKKLEKLAKKQCSNFALCERNYKEIPNKKSLLKSRNNTPIKTSTLHIKPTRTYASSDELLNFLAKGDNKIIDNETLFVYFSLEKENQDYCTYFALRDLGLKYIPIYVDKETYKIGHALKLFKEN